MKKFKVRLSEGHKAKEDQIIDGFLGNIFDDGKVAEYTRGEAIKKARSFGGKIEEVKEIFILGEDSINGIVINEKIRDEGLHEFYIVDREEFIDTLIDWISEARESKSLMKQDLKMLMQWEDEYIFSSNSTNDYIRQEDPRFNDVCKELLELNNTI